MKTLKTIKLAACLIKRRVMFVSKLTQPAIQQDLSKLFKNVPSVRHTFLHETLMTKDGLIQACVSYKGNIS